MPVFNSILFTVLFATTVHCSEGDHDLLQNPIMESSVDLQMTIDLAEHALGELKHGDKEQAKRDIRKLQVIGENYHEEVTKISDLLQDQKRLLDDALKKSKISQKEIERKAEERMREKFSLSERSRHLTQTLIDLEKEERQAEMDADVAKEDLSNTEFENKAKGGISAFVGAIVVGALTGLIPGGLTGPGGMAVGAIAGAVGGYNALGKDTSEQKVSIQKYEKQIKEYREEIDKTTGDIRLVESEIEKMDIKVEKQRRRHLSLKQEACYHNNSITVVAKALQYFTLISELVKHPDDEMYNLEVIISVGKIKVMTIHQCDDVSKLNIVTLMKAWTMVQIRKEKCDERKEKSDQNSCSCE